MTTSRINHEDIHVAEKKRSELVRPDRFDVIDQALVAEIAGKEYEVVNYSSFGLAILCDHEFNGSERDPVEAVLRSDGIDVAKASLRQRRVEELPGVGLKVAFEVVGRALSLESINAVFEAKELAASVASARGEFVRVPEKFRAAVYEVKDVLEDLKQKLDSLQSERKFTSREEHLEYESTVAVVISDFLFSVFKPTYESLSASLGNQSEETVKHCFHFFRSKLNHLIYESPFAHRSYSKPLGYAGDYEMMNQIYRNESSGDTLFGKCMHRYYLDHPETKAVRNRAEYLNAKLRKLLEKREPGKPLKLLSVASGPAMEVQMLLRQNGGLDLSRLEIHLLDQDIVSLKHAQQKIRALILEKGLSVEVKYFNTAIRNVIGRGLQESGYDLIYSAGLFDYFSDPVATAAAQKIFKSVSPGGSMIIGNFNLTSPNQFLMAIALDWHLIYRSHEDLTRLYQGIGGDLSIEQEPESVNLFCVLKKA